MATETELRSIELEYQAARQEYSGARRVLNHATQRLVSAITAMITADPEVVFYMPTFSEIKSRQTDPCPPPSEQEENHLIIARFAGGNPNRATNLLWTAVWADEDGADWAGLVIDFSAAQDLAFDTGGKLVETMKWDGGPFGDNKSGTISAIGRHIYCDTDKGVEFLRRRLPVEWSVTKTAG